jgi:purine-binding chemotaxis protein CheW
MAAERTLATFTVERIWCGIEVAQVQEVLHGQTLEPVPLAPRGVVGLLNLRGQVLAATDLRARMELPPREDPGSLMVFIVQHARVFEALVVDAPGPVVTIPADSPLLAAPPTTPEAIAVLLRGVSKHRDGLLCEVSLQALFGVFDGQTG